MQVVDNKNIVLCRFGLLCKKNGQAVSAFWTYLTFVREDGAWVRKSCYLAYLKVSGRSRQCAGDLFGVAKIY